MGKVVNKLRELTEEELSQQLEQSKKELMDQRFEMVTGHVTNVKQLKNTKKRIARILTLKKEKDISKKK